MPSRDNPSPPVPMVRVLRVVLTVCSFGVLGWYLTVVFGRVGYPFELEWQEGGILEHVRRSMAGIPLYGPPTVEFVPFLYPSLYYWLSGFGCRFLGTGFLSLRLISILASLGSAWVLFRIVRAETGDKWAGMIGASLFLAAFEAGGAWSDIGRVDSLFLFLTLEGVAALHPQTPGRPAILGGILLALAVLTKQSAMIIALPILALAPRSLGRKGWLAGGAFFLVAGGVVGAQNWASEGWFWFYVFTLPGQHSIAWDFLGGFWMDDLLRPLPIALAIGGTGLLILMGRRRDGSVAVPILAFLLAGFFGRLHSGGYRNVVLPAIAGISLAWGIGWSVLDQEFSLRGRVGNLLRIPLLLLVLGQVWWLLDVPGRFQPSEEDKTQGEVLQQRFSQLKGSVFAPSFGYLLRGAGKIPQAHSSALFDLMRCSDDSIRASLAEDLLRVVQPGSFSHAVLGNRETFLGPLVASRFPKGVPLISPPGVFFPRTGYRIRPEILYSSP